MNEAIINIISRRTMQGSQGACACKLNIDSCRYANLMKNLRPCVIKLNVQECQFVMSMLPSIAIYFLLCDSFIP